MKSKFLPIGTVCTIKGNSKKVMITGFLQNEFNVNLKKYDYMGVAFPEGFLLSNRTCLFNHSDIINIDFMGFNNDEQQKFHALLTKELGTDFDLIEDAKMFHVDDDMFLTSNDTFSKLLFDENGVVMIAEDNVVENDESNFEFDENGVVVSEKEIKNPFKKEIKKVENVDDNKNVNEWSIFKEVKFDENGVVVSAKENEFEFDENGVVISENNEEEIPAIGPGLPGYIEPTEEEFEFDENGVVISENNEEEKFKFDENGIVIEEV